MNKNINQQLLQQLLEESIKIKSLAFRKAGVFTELYFEEQKTYPSALLFTSKKGQFVRLIFSLLESTFNVDIEHIEADKAVQFLEKLSYDDFRHFDVCKPSRRY